MLGVSGVVAEFDVVLEHSIETRRVARSLACFMESVAGDFWGGAVAIVVTRVVCLG